MNSEPGKTPIPGWSAVAALTGLFLTALALWKDAVGSSPKLDEVPYLSPQYYDTSTVRVVRKDMTFGGAPCQSCHDGAEPLQGNPKERGVFHDAIELKHGRNQHCFNCHHRLQPANFSNFDGAPIMLANIQLLCSRCHGTIYRDWNAGAHGRRTGFWAEARGGPSKTVCIACHNPHWPVFKEIQASPPPHASARSRKGPAKALREDLGVH